MTSKFPPDGRPNDFLAYVAVYSHPYTKVECLDVASWSWHPWVTVKRSRQSLTRPYGWKMVGVSLAILEEFERVDEKEWKNPWKKP